MSETDDTDVLLLIPPNFFLVQSSGSEDSLLESSRTVVHKPLSCTAQVIGKLVNQVQTLETRLESLEISTDLSSFGSKTARKIYDTTDSVDSRSLDRKCFTFPRRCRRKIVRKESKRELSLTSLDSVDTCRNSIPSLHLNRESAAIESINDTRSMDGDISSIVSTPSKKTDKLLLNEIDEFLTKVESYESPESKYKECESTLSSDNIIKATSHYLSQKLDSKHDEEQIKLPSGRVVNSNILDKYIYLVKNSGSSPEKTVPSCSSYKNHYETINQTMESTIKHNITKQQETKSPSIRKLNFDKDVQPTSTPKCNTQSFLDTFRPSSNKIYDRATKVLEQYKAQTSRNTENSGYLHQTQKNDFKMPQMRPFSGDNKDGNRLQNKLLDSIDTDLLSLSELWGEKADQECAERVDSKLEEERLKREHCESIIQQLQKKVLEQQEKIAVAMKVDKSKDVAISKLKEAWLRLTGSLDKAEERHRGALEKMIREVENFKMVAEDTQKKTNHFETELYKALDLAHDYQEKCKQLTSEKQELQESLMKALTSKQEVIEGKDMEIDSLKENYETVMRLNKQSTDCVKSLEDALEKEKLEHDQSKHKIVELTGKLQSAADDTALVAQERDLLKEKVNEERARCSMVERQLAEKQNLASELLKKCDTLDAETRSLRKHLDVQKVELKSHYQKQLEDAVLGKLQQFQAQLELAARELEDQARSKENDIIDTFNKQISRIEEQHKLEINVLEEKQREEIKLYRLQLAQAGEKTELLESKLESYKRRRGQLASQLHGVMQAQWRQALNILTHQHALDGPRTDAVSTPVAQDYAPKIPSLTMPQFAEKLTAPDPEHKRLNFEELSDHELRHYVKLLLTRPPSVAGGDDEPTSDRPDRERRDRPKRTLNNSKPPWKS